MQMLFVWNILYVILNVKKKTNFDHEQSPP